MFNDCFLQCANLLISNRQGIHAIHPVQYCYSNPRRVSPNFD